MSRGFVRLPISSAPNASFIDNMDTYPQEFVVHLIPVMAIIGLSPESPPLNAIQHPGDPSFKLSSRGRSASTSVSSELSQQPATGRPRRSSLVIGQPASQTRTVNKTLLSLLTGKSPPTVWEVAKFTPVTGGVATGSSGTVTGLPVFHVVPVDKVCCKLFKSGPSIACLIIRQEINMIQHLIRSPL